MDNLNLFAAFLIGFAGSTHCIGMCGGIVSALSFSVPRNRSPMMYILNYNIGRIASYTIAGALTGYLGTIFTAQIKQGLHILQIISAVFLMLLACYIGGWWKVLAELEKCGQLLWRVLQPLSRKLVPLKTPLWAFPYGMIWGWLPCGLVYSTLVWSLASGSAFNGAATMLMFGLGTLPALITMGLLGQWLKNWLYNPTTRQLMAGLLLIFSSLLLFSTFYRV